MARKVRDNSTRSINKVLATLGSETQVRTVNTTAEVNKTGILYQVSGESALFLFEDGEVVRTDKQVAYRYASNVTNISVEGIAPTQDDVVGFSVNPNAANGDPLEWEGTIHYLSVVPSNDPTDYVWVNVKGERGFSITTSETSGANPGETSTITIVNEDPTVADEVVTLQPGTVGATGDVIKDYFALTAYDIGDLVQSLDTQWRAIAAIPDTNDIAPTEGTGKWSQVMTASQVVDDLDLTGSTLKLEINGSTVGSGVTLPSKFTAGEARDAVNAVVSGDGNSLTFLGPDDASHTFTPVTSGTGEANVQADYTESDTNADSFIKNKPSIPTQYTNALARDAVDAVISGDGNSLTFFGPDDSSHTFTPVTAGAGEANVQVDWTEMDTNSDAFILNKPATHSRFTQAEARQSVSLSNTASTLTYKDNAGATQTFTPIQPGAGEANVQSDWTEETTTEDAFILNKPTESARNSEARSALAISDDGSTLTYKNSAGSTQTFTPISPGTGEANVQSDYTETDTNSDSFIKNKPTIPTKFTAAEARDALAISDDGSTLTYIDDTNTVQTFTPISPGTGEANVQSNWSETDDTDDSFIQNKPSIPTQYTDAQARTAVLVAHSGGTLTYKDQNGTSQAFTPAIGSQADWDETDVLDAAFIANKPTTISAAQTTRLAGIEAGAEVNIQADWTASNSASDAFIQNKPTIAEFSGETATGNYTVPVRDAGATTTKFLREDGDWVVPAGGGGGGGGTDTISAAPVSFQTLTSAPSLTASFTDSTADNAFGALFTFNSGT